MKIRVSNISSTVCVRDDLVSSLPGCNRNSFFFQVGCAHVPNANPHVYTHKKKRSYPRVQSQPRSRILKWQRRRMFATSDSSRWCGALPLLYAEEIYRLLMELDRRVAAVIAATLWRPPGWRRQSAPPATCGLAASDLSPVRPSPWQCC